MDPAETKGKVTMVNIQVAIALEGSFKVGDDVWYDLANDVPVLAGFPINPNSATVVGFEGITETPIIECSFDTTAEAERWSSRLRTPGARAAMRLKRAMAAMAKG